MVLIYYLMTGTSTPEYTLFLLRPAIAMIAYPLEKGSLNVKLLSSKPEP